MSQKLMISAGEASGELYGALLSKEVRKLWPDIEIFGIGGHRMEEEGVELISRISCVMGFTEAIKHLSELKKCLNKAGETLLLRRPDVLVLIDYPDFNLALAKRAKAAGIPVLYYVSPQVWAWREGRVHKIAALVDKMAVLFPFEVSYYEKVGLPCEFVGHPILETINITKTKEELKQELGLAPDRPVISLLPGSRPTEISRHMPILTGLTAMIRNELPDYQIIMPLAQGTQLLEKPADNVTVLYNSTRESLACSDAAIVASGTATLETALFGTPMVVFFKTSFLSFHIAKLLVKIKFISLVNLLSDKQVVTELLQREATADNIMSHLKKILSDNEYRNHMINDLNKVKETMHGKRPSERVAAIVGEIAGWTFTKT